MALEQLRFKELGEEEPAWKEESLDSAKALTAKLKLQTRRPSYLEWEARMQGQPWCTQTPGATRGAQKSMGHPKDQHDGGICGFTTMEAFLEWLRIELQEMQAMDQHLAQQLMRLRAQLHQLKVKQACHQHKKILDDATFGLKGCKENSDLLCNIPPKAAFLLSMPLKHIGVTRMNITSRQFSLC